MITIRTFLKFQWGGEYLFFFFKTVTLVGNRCVPRRFLFFCIKYALSKGECRHRHHFRLHPVALYVCRPVNTQIATRYIRDWNENSQARNSWNIHIINKDRRPLPPNNLFCQCLAIHNGMRACSTSQLAIASFIGKCSPSLTIKRRKTWYHFA